MANIGAILQKYQVKASLEKQSDIFTWACSKKLSARRLTPDIFVKLYQYLLYYFL